ncbi:MAG: class D beta-lactamase [Bacteroidales bacterium]|nr:class D beta-lactamase [Bacteroidales bacterium]
MKKVIIILAVISFVSCAENEKIIHKDLTQYFKGLEGTFVLFNPQDNSYTIHNQERANNPFNPKSTFKIPNSLFAIEAGVLENAGSIIAWDSILNPRQPWWPEAWPKEQTLHSALRNSVVWYYQEVARRIGEDRMQGFLNQADYGNKIIGPRIDAFWLDNTLKISAMEQVDFLVELYNNSFGFSEKAVRVVKEILVYEETATYTLSAKTGGGEINNLNVIGWFVGYVEKGEEIFYFALNIEGESFQGINQPRINISKDILTALQIID